VDLIVRADIEEYDFASADAQNQHDPVLIGKADGVLALAPAVQEAQFQPRTAGVRLHIDS